MTVILDKINEINEVLKDISNFIQNNEKIRNDFSEYLSTIGSTSITQNQIEKIFLPYVFERMLDGQSIISLYLEENKSYENVAKGLLNSQASIFEIKKVLKNGFELYNLVNEKTYTVLSLTKMTNFRGIYAGQYIVARIFELNGDYYIIEISNVLSHSQKEDAYRYAVMKLINTPMLLYFDNPEKENEIKNAISEMYDRFINAFGSDIILTTNKHADEIIGAFNDGEKVDLTDKLCDLKEYKFFVVKELENSYSNFLEKSVGGFSSHEEIYDVAVIFDKEKGLYAVPFYETFNKIFENKDLIENADSCIEYFLKNTSISDKILDRVYSQHKNFMEVINQCLNQNYSYETLIKEYKSDFIDNVIYSSATVLYCSRAFSEVFEYLSTESEDKPSVIAKVGRNEPCPCGSGKKYKNCCGKV